MGMEKGMARKLVDWLIDGLRPPFSMAYADRVVMQGPWQATAGTSQNHPIMGVALGYIFSSNAAIREWVIDWLERSIEGDLGLQAGEPLSATYDHLHTLAIAAIWKMSMRRNGDSRISDLCHQYFRSSTILAVLLSTQWTEGYLVIAPGARCKRKGSLTRDGLARQVLSLPGPKPPGSRWWNGSDGAALKWLGNTRLFT